jgi:hypothetical protein
MTSGMARGTHSLMNEISHSPQAPSGPTLAFGLWLMGGAGALMTAAGGLLWWREGERLFTDGLIAAIMRCF